MNRIRSIGVYPARVWVTSYVQSLRDAGEILKLLRENCFEARIWEADKMYLAVKVRTVTLPKLLGMIAEHSQKIYIGEAFPRILSERGRELANAFNRRL